MELQIPSPPPTVRYWCSIDDTPLGKTSLAYADTFAGMGFPVRLIATQMGALAQQTMPGKPWERHRGAFLTPVNGTFVNVVCGRPDDWKRLYTVGVKNVLIATSEPPTPEQTANPLAVPVIGRHGEMLEVAKLGDVEIAREVALKYQVIIVPTEEISSAWKAIGGNAVVIPMGLGQHALELRRALFC